MKNVTNHEGSFYLMLICDNKFNLLSSNNKHFQNELYLLNTALKITIRTYYEINSSGISNIH